MLKMIYQILPEEMLNSQLFQAQTFGNITLFNNCGYFIPKFLCAPIRKGRIVKILILVNGNALKMVENLIQIYLFLT